MKLLLSIITCLLLWSVYTQEDSAKVESKDYDIKQTIEKAKLCTDDINFDDISVDECKAVLEIIRNNPLDFPGTYNEPGPVILPPN